MLQGTQVLQVQKVKTTYVNLISWRESLIDNKHNPQSHIRLGLDVQYCQARKKD